MSRGRTIRMAAARAFEDAPASWSVRMFERAPNDADVIVVTPEIDDESRADVRFDPDDPQRALEEVAARLRRAGSVIVVTGLAGAGVTTVALHLAAELGRRAASCVVDLDPDAGAARRLALPEEMPSWAELDDADDSLWRCAQMVPPGFRVLSSPGDGTAPNVESIVARAVGAFTYVVIDAPRRGPLADVLECAGAGLFVVPPALPAARRACTVLDGLPETRWAVVTNRLGPGGESTRRALEAPLRRKVALELPCVPAVRDVEDEGALFRRPWSRWHLRIVQMARGIEAACAH